jgi:hypothetical protein
MCIEIHPDFRQQNCACSMVRKGNINISNHIFIDISRNKSFRVKSISSSAGGSMSKEYKPGDEAPTSGQYLNTTTKTEVTVTKGEPMPPTPSKGQSYVLVDKTKHKKP